MLINVQGVTPFPMTFLRQFVRNRQTLVVPVRSLETTTTTKELYIHNFVVFNLLNDGGRRLARSLARQSSRTRMYCAI
jgi:hypothetical protein